MPARVVEVVSRCTLCAALAFALACDLNNPGDAPPEGTLYFPTALALSGDGDGAPDHLYVANSNFDLRFNAGSVQAFDLDAIGEVITTCEACIGRAEQAQTECRDACASGDCVQVPDAGLDLERTCDACLELCDDARAADDEACGYDDGKCFVDPVDETIRVGEERVESFATAIVPSRDGALLFVVGREDDGLTFVPADGSAPDVLDCGAGAAPCAKRSTRADADLPDWPGDPVDLLTGPLSDWGDTTLTGDYVLVAHRGGAVSLFVERSEAGERGFVWTDTLTLFSAQSGVQLTGIARDPQSGLAHLTLLRSARGVVATGKLLARVGVVLDDDPERASLYDAGALALEGVDVSTDTRAIAFVDPIAQSSAALAGVRALVVARLPTSLLLVAVDPSHNEVGRARVQRITEVGSGATRLVTGTLGGTPVAIVSCFDSREVFVIDLESGFARSIVRNLSGPFEIVLDEARQRLYAADFRSSVIRVLDLAPVLAPDASGETSARLVATLGAPRVIQELR